MPWTEPDPGTADPLVALAVRVDGVEALMADLREQVNTLADWVADVAAGDR